MYAKRQPKLYATPAPPSKLGPPGDTIFSAGFVEDRFDFRNAFQSSANVLVECVFELVFQNQKDYKICYTERPCKADAGK